MSDKDSRIIMPTAGRCLHCANPQPCWAHTEIRLKRLDGGDIVVPNLPTLLSVLIERIAALEKRVGVLAQPRVTIE